MEIIANLCDQILLGTQGRCSGEETVSVRVILRDDQDKYAVLYDNKKSLYYLPVIPIKNARQPVEDIQYWIPVLTGCSIRGVTPLCAVAENSLFLNRRMVTQYYLAETDAFQRVSWQEKVYRSDNAVLQWMDLYEMGNKLKRPLHAAAEELYSQFKDCIAVGYYSQICPEEQEFHGGMIAPGLVISPGEDLSGKGDILLPKSDHRKKKYEYDLFYGGIMEIIGPSHDEDAIG